MHLLDRQPTNGKTTNEYSHPTCDIPYFTCY